jgi:Ca2+/Na+ antiporter
MFTIGILAGAVGLYLVPVLLGRLFCDKELLVTILSTVVASALFFIARVVLTQISWGVLLVYIGVVLINICTSSYRHERKDGRRDERYSAKNNPFYAGLFSGAMPYAIIAMTITFVYQGITGGGWGPISIIYPFFSGFFVGIYEIFFKTLLQ